MADDKKTNLPAVIKNLPVEVKNLPSTEVSRRNFLRGLSGTVARGALDTISTGSLVDLLKDDNYSHRPSSISESLADVTSAVQRMASKQIVHDFHDVPLPTILQDTLPDELDIDGIVHGYDSLVETWENAQYEMDEIVDLMEAGYYPITDPSDRAFYENHFDFFKEKINEANKLDSDIRDSMANLKIAFKDKYPEDFTEWLFNSPTGQHILNSARDKIDNIYPELISYKTDIREIENTVLPELLQTAFKNFKIEQEIQNSLEQQAKLSVEDLEAPKDKTKDRIKKLAGAAGSQALSRALTQLAKPKDPKQKQIQKAKGPKQIAGPEKTEKPSINKLLSALSAFKRTSPIGAGLYMMKPTELARDDDYGFEIPVDR